MQTIAELLAQELGASPVHVQNVIDLLDQGNTIPVSYTHLTLPTN